MYIDNDSLKIVHILKEFVLEVIEYHSVGTNKIKENNN